MTSKKSIDNRVFKVYNDHRKFERGAKHDEPA